MSNSSPDKKEIALDSNKTIFPQTNSVEIEAVVEKGNETGWKLDPIPLNIKDYIKKINFADEEHGFFITAQESVFKTVDGGKSWTKETSLPDAAIDIYLVSPNEGFALSLKLTAERTVAASLLLKTEDAGKTWKTVLTSNGVIFERIAFNAEGMGVIIGRRDINTPKPDALNFILVSTDRGGNWSDVSEKINQITPNSDKAWRVSDYLKDIVFSETGSISVVSDRGKLYNSNDFGKSWELEAKLVPEGNQTAIVSFGKLKGGKLWMSGSSFTNEGKKALLAVISTDESVKYRLGGYNFSQVTFLSNDEVIAVGKRDFGWRKELNEGVVLFSNNGGKNWTVLYQSKTANEFTSMVEISKNKLFVTGAGGNLLLLERN